MQKVNEFVGMVCNIRLYMYSNSIGTYIELNMLRRAVKANPIANIDFIFT